MDALVQPPHAAAAKKMLAADGVLAVNPSDTRCFEELARRHGLKRRFLFNAQLFSGTGFFVAGPAVGAPMAALCLESLITLGARRIIVYGWCGALLEPLRVGALFMPLAALSEEGTSRHYPHREEECDPSLAEALHAWLVNREHAVRRGTLWTTDAPFRETREKISAYGAQGVWAVEMEYAALRAVAAFRRVQLAALFMVSDELYRPMWRPAFTAESFRRTSRQRLQELCTFFETQHP